MKPERPGTYDFATVGYVLDQLSVLSKRRKRFEIKVLRTVPTKGCPRAKALRLAVKDPRCVGVAFNHAGKHIFYQNK